MNESTYKINPPTMTLLLRADQTHTHTTQNGIVPIVKCFVSTSNGRNGAVGREGNMFSEFLVFEVNETHDSLVEPGLN